MSEALAALTTAMELAADEGSVLELQGCAAALERFAETRPTERPGLVFAAALLRKRVAAIRNEMASRDAE